MILVGVSILSVYTAAAVGGLLLLQWVVANPPNPFFMLGVFVSVALLGGYVGYKRGVVQTVASIDTLRVTPERAPELYRRLERLCLRMDVSQPALLVADFELPNALSVGGPREGAIILDRGLFEILTIDELEGILAHELAHIERLDTFLNTLAITVARLIASLVFLVFAPFIIFLAGIDRATAWFGGRPGKERFGLANVFQQTVGFLVVILLSFLTVLFLAHSRRQEFAADRRAAEVSGRPLALARALVKIHKAAEPRRNLRSLLYIHQDTENEPSRWLSTHPPLDDRVDKLVELSQSQTGGQKLRQLRPESVR
jgi:heat shock protein HtpX